MLRIPCPWCGVRDEDEFRYGGPANLLRPPLDSSDTTWSEYLFMRENPKGAHRERWLHAFGCDRWFDVTRHTLTHEIFASNPREIAAPIRETTS